MSGGKEQNKVRVNKGTHGWEEAGSEFYQESFPTDLDGAIQRDPAAIATLLPSKQNRAGNLTTYYTRHVLNELSDFITLQTLIHFSSIEKTTKRKIRDTDSNAGSSDK